jgi:hypothetical protein
LTCQPTDCSPCHNPSGPHACNLACVGCVGVPGCTAPCTSSCGGPTNLCTACGTPGCGRHPNNCEHEECPVTGCTTRPPHDFRCPINTTTHPARTCQTSNCSQCSVCSTPCNLNCIPCTDVIGCTAPCISVCGGPTNLCTTGCGRHPNNCDSIECPAPTCTTRPPHDVRCNVCEARTCQAACTPCPAVECVQNSPTGCRVNCGAICSNTQGCGKHSDVCDCCQGCNRSQENCVCCQHCGFFECMCCEPNGVCTEIPNHQQRCQVPGTPHTNKTCQTNQCAPCGICSAPCDLACSQCGICGAACVGNCSPCGVCSLACNANCTQCTICSAACNANCAQCTHCAAPCRASCIPCTLTGCPQNTTGGCSNACVPCAVTGCPNQIAGSCRFSCTRCTETGCAQNVAGGCDFACDHLDVCPICGAPTDECPSATEVGICCPSCEVPSCPLCPDCNRRRAVNPGDCMCTCDEDRPEPIVPVDPGRPAGQSNSVRNANCTFAGCSRTNVPTCPCCGYCRQCEWQYFGIIHCTSCQWGGDCLASEGTAIDWCSQHNQCHSCCGCGPNANIVLPGTATIAGRLCVYCSERVHCSACSVPVCGDCNWIRFGVVTCPGCRRDGDCISAANGTWTAGQRHC